MRVGRGNAWRSWRGPLLRVRGRVAGAARQGCCQTFPQEPVCRYLRLPSAGPTGPRKSNHELLIGACVVGESASCSEVAFQRCSVFDRDREGSMARLTWCSKNWKLRQAQGGCCQFVAPRGQGAGMVQQFLHQQSHGQAPVQPRAGATFAVLGQMKYSLAQEAQPPVPTAQYPALSSGPAACRVDAHKRQGPGLSAEMAGP